MKHKRPKKTTNKKAIARAVVYMALRYAIKPVMRTQDTLESAHYWMSNIVDFPSDRLITDALHELRQDGFVSVVYVGDGGYVWYLNERVK